ncbi:MAG: aminopeptidase P family protein [Spirochaetaceae bacterium]|nr:MAG: aminopeptidase P family protein [Spirochaetaceae bacterium]
MNRKNKPPFDASKLFALMENLETDLLLASSRHNIRYLTGGYYYPLYMWDAHARRTQYLSFLAIVRNSLGDTFYVGRPGEREVMQEAEVWPELCFESERIGSLSTAARIVEVLKQRNLGTGRIAVEMPSLPADVFELLKTQLPRAEFVDAVPMMDKLRAVKTPEEIEIIRKGTKKNLEALKTVLTSGRDGSTTAEIAQAVSREFRLRELHFLYALVCAGPEFFRAPSEKRSWRRDRALHIDAGGLAAGYVVELCRMGYLGKPSAIADDLLQGCRDLEKVVLGVLQPGIEGGNLQRSADAFLEKHPIGEHGKFIAHGIGLVHHEDPVINSGSTDLMEEGMVLSIEMEFRYPQVGHIKLEDMVVITKTGNEVLSPEGREWFISIP